VKYAEDKKALGSCPALRLGPCLAFAAVLALLSLPPARSEDRPPTNVGKQVPGFSVTDPRTKLPVSLADYKDSKALVVVFLGCECPVANAFLPRLSELHKDFAERGVQFLGINSNTQDSPERVAEHARKHDVPFPVLKDEKNVVADLLEAVRTPEAFVLDGERKIRYRGRIDDQYGINVQRPKPTQTDLVAALEEVLAGKAVSVPVTTAAGCKIGRAVELKTDGTVTYSKQVARILQQNCQECHRPGQIGPFSLLEYRQAVAWSAAIREAVEDERMPPWYADPHFGKFSNDRRLSKEDRQTLLAWIDQGMPKGDDKELPPPRQFEEGWRMGKPDLVIQMPREFEVPAKGGKNGIAYKYFPVDSGFKEDRWVQIAEARPGTPAVVHHIILFISPPGEVFMPDAPGAVLCGTAPGDTMLILPEGMARKVPAGSRLIFQMHYTPNGTVQKDRSSVGLIFAKKPPERRVLTVPIDNRLFTTHVVNIPPGVENFKLQSEFTFKEDGHVMAFMPHMHLRGKDFLIEAVYPDGKTQTLLSVPRFNFNWQSVYRYEKPVPMPKGSEVRCLAHFDNSDKNPNNPDPTRWVSWGDQTWEEMMIGWMDYTLEKKAE
jgi:peroxiredoxin